jgi:hypothetical protein
MKKKIITITILLLPLTLILLLNLPILHQTLHSSTTHFSIMTAIQTDISEHDFQTWYFILHIFDK